MEIKKWLNTTITRRDAIVATAKSRGGGDAKLGDYAAFCYHCPGAGYPDTEGCQRRNRQAQRLSGQLWQPMPA